MGRKKRCKKYERAILDWGDGGVALRCSRCNTNICIWWNFTGDKKVGVIEMMNRYDAHKCGGKR